MINRQLLFKKFKPFLDLTYMWEFPNKLFIPPHPDFTMIHTEELFIKNRLPIEKIRAVTRIKCFLNEEIVYAQSAFLDSRKKAKKIHNIMIHNKEYLIGSRTLEASIAHVRYIELSHANYRIANVLKCNTVT
jgi:hypothetical protein